MNIYLAQNVLDEALERMRFVFREFEHVYVNTSGGKDSTVVLNLALQVAAEMNRLPLNVTFIDQEAEWDTVITHMRAVMDDPRVTPYWYQMPIQLFNATSPLEPWLYCWREGSAWIRPKEPGSITRNIYGTPRFAELFGATLKTDHPHAKAARIAGVRAEESPARRMGLTTYPCYKGVTWGSKMDAKLEHVVFYPIYDWRTEDVWKAIHAHQWPYCRLYDYMYQYGIPLRQMRVSNVHHETAGRSLFFLQEIEPETWDKITARISGINTAGHLRWDFYAPKDLPPMFADWREYRDHLLDNLIIDPAIQATMRKQFTQSESYFDDPKVLHDLVRLHIDMIMNNDYHGTKLSTFSAAHFQSFKGRGKISGRRPQAVLA